MTAACPACGAPTREGDWICGSCDHILDPSVFERPAIDQGAASVASTWCDDDAVPDAMIVGDAPSGPDDSRVVRGAATADDGKTQSFLLYTSASTTRVLRPTATPYLKVERSKGEGLTPYEAFLLDAIDGRRTVLALAELAGLSFQEVTFSLITLLDKGWIGVDAARPSDAPPLEEPATDQHRAIGPEDVGATLEEPDLAEPAAALVGSDELTPIPAPPSRPGPPPVATSRAPTPPGREPTPLPAPIDTGVFDAPASPVARRAAPPAPARPAPSPARPPPPSPARPSAPPPRPAPTAKKADPRPTAEAMARAEELFAQALKDRALGNLGSARMNMKLALSFDPSNALIRQAIDDMTHGQRAEATRARQLYDEATEFEKAGKLDLAIARLEAAIDEAPEPAFFNRLGVLLAMNKIDLARARTLVERAIALAPSQPIYEANLRKVLAMQANAQLTEDAGRGKKKGGILDGWLGRKR